MTLSEKAPRLLFVVTHPMTALILMRGQLSYLNEQGFKIGIVSSSGKELESVALLESVEVFEVQMTREITPFKDFFALFQLYRVIRRFKPDIVNASTPKAGLLGMLAATMAGVYVRVYTLRGLRLETESGIKRQILKICERISSCCAHRIICVSESLRKCYLKQGLASLKKTCVMGAGSSNGVDTSLFRTETVNGSARLKMRSILNIPETSPVIGFVGRLCRDKGIGDLLEIFHQVSATYPDLRLLLIGEFESEGNEVADELILAIGKESRIIHTGFISDTAPYYSAMDLAVFPSYREGFPNVLLEAAAASVPSVGFKSTGVTDAVLNGMTGNLVPKGDIEAMTQMILNYLNRPDMIKKHGKRARKRVEQLFQGEKIWRSWENEYRRLMEHHFCRSL